MESWKPGPNPINEIFEEAGEKTRKTTGPTKGLDQLPCFFHVWFFSGAGWFGNCLGQDVFGIGSAWDRTGSFSRIPRCLRLSECGSRDRFEHHPEPHKSRPGVLESDTFRMAQSPSVVDMDPHLDILGHQWVPAPSSPKPFETTRSSCPIFGRESPRGNMDSRRKTF